MTSNPAAVLNMIKDWLRFGATNSKLDFVCLEEKLSNKLSFREFSEKYLVCHQHLRVFIHDFYLNNTVIITATSSAVYIWESHRSNVKRLLSANAS